MRGAPFRVARGGGHGHFQRVVSGARIAIGKHRDLAQQLSEISTRLRAQAALFVFQGAVEQRQYLIGRERRKHVDLGAGEQRRDDFERRVFRGGADQHHVAALDVGQKGVLLRFVEAMNFVNEKHRSPAVMPRLFRRRHHFLDFLDAGEDGAEAHEVAARFARDDRGQRGLAGARRAPEDHRAQFVALDLLAQRLARPQDVKLAHEFLDGLRPHAVGERRRVAARWRCGRGEVGSWWFE